MDLMGEDYPEILSAKDAIHEVTRREEMRFAETISTGLQLLDQEFRRVAGEGSGRLLPGADLFRLYDTYGLPLDLARDIAGEQGFELDEEGFDREMAGQRARAQASWKGPGKAETAGVYGELSGSVGSCFEGYGLTRMDGAKVLALIRDSRRVDLLREGEEGEVVLDRTPFYAEAGGQVGDTGWLGGETVRAEVLDTVRPAEGLAVSRVRLESGELAVGQEVLAEVDEARRNAIRRNHTATHLLHAALREVVGTHVKQAGSLVAPDRLRFDFSHFAPLTDRALADIESLVNRKILESIAVETVEMDLDEAVRGGAMALFGEKYEDRVRVVRIGDFSLELCGGTHCSDSAAIGLFKLVQERGIASGTRRVEAVTGEGSLARFQELSGIVRSLEELLAVPGREVIREAGKRLEQVKALQKELERHRLGEVRSRLLREAAEAKSAAGVRFLTGRADALQPGEMRELADNLRRKLGSGVVVLGRGMEGKASILVAVTSDLTDRIAAGDLVRSLAGMIGGGGGGRKDLAEAGGKNPERLDEALDAVEAWIVQRMEGMS
jgi:alanyl-tRNA synthetase